jgi:hypothetical protein
LINELERDARDFFRLIQRGQLTREEARNDLLPTPALLAIIESDYGESLPGVWQTLAYRRKVWDRVTELLAAGHQRKSAVRDVSQL